MAFADIASQAMSAATVSKACKPNVLMLILLMTFVSFSAADCPDADVRCRIPASDADTTVTAMTLCLL